MTDTLEKIPPRPLLLNEAVGMENAFEYALRPDTEEVLVLLVVGEDRAHALGYEAEREGWVTIEHVPIADPEKSVPEIERAIEAWTEEAYGEELASGDVEMVSNDDRERHRYRDHVETGLAAAYDCPECDAYGTSETVPAHVYLAHLQEEHGYTPEEAQAEIER